MKKSLLINWATHFLTVAHNGVCCPNISLGMAGISSGALLAEKKIDDSSRLDVDEIARVA